MMLCFEWSLLRKSRLVVFMDMLVLAVWLIIEISFMPSGEVFLSPLGEFELLSSSLAWSLSIGMKPSFLPESWFFWVKGCVELLSNTSLSMVT